MCRGEAGAVKRGREAGRCNRSRCKGEQGSEVVRCRTQVGVGTVEGSKGGRRRRKKRRRRKVKIGYNEM